MNGQVFTNDRRWKESKIRLGIKGKDFQRKTVQKNVVFFFVVSTILFAKESNDGTDLKLKQ